MARIRVRKSLIVDMSEDEAIYTLDALVEKMQRDKDVAEWVYKFAQSFAQALDVEIESQQDESEDEDDADTEESEGVSATAVPTHAPGKSRTVKKG